MVTTPNYSFALPEDTASLDVWGSLLNVNWADVDTVLFDKHTAIAAVETDTDASDVAVATNSADQVTSASAISSTTSDVAQAAIDFAALSALYMPVGYIYISVIAEYPATTLGFGTWAPYASGQALAGAGTNSDSVWSAGDERGSLTHILTVPELARHKHAIFTTRSNDESSSSKVSITSGGDNKSTTFVGNNIAHNNVMPSLGVQMWIRTS